MPAKSIRTVTFLVFLAGWAIAPSTARLQEVELCAVDSDDSDNAECNNESCSGSATATCNAACEGSGWQWENDPTNSDGECVPVGGWHCGGCGIGTCYTRMNLKCHRTPPPI